jgi:hypothetical protein
MKGNISVKPLIKGIFRANTALMLQCAAGFIVMLICMSKYGPGLTHDSVAYLYAADGLLNGRGMVYFGYGTPFVQWPPLLPFLLASLKITGLDPINSIRFINALVYALTVYFSGLWLTHNVKIRILSIIGQAAAFSVPLVYVSKHLWTEGMFILFILLFLSYSSRFVINGASKDLVLMSVFASLSVLTRYAGITAIAVGVLVIAAHNGKAVERLRKMIIFLSISCTPLMLWLIRNYLVFSTFTGRKLPSATPLVKSIKDAYTTVFSWFFPYSKLSVTDRYRMRLLVFFILACLFAAVVYRLLKNRDHLYCKELLYNNTRVIPFVLFIFIYAAFLLFSVSTIAVDPIDDRLMSPVYVPLTLVVFYTIGRLCEFFSRGNSAGRIILCVLAALWLIYPFSGAASMVTDSVRNGAGGYSKTTWRDSSIIAYLKDNKPESIVFSNFPDAVYVLSGISARYIPEKLYSAYYDTANFKRVFESADSRQALIAWFNRGMSVMEYIYNEIGPDYTVKTVFENDEGLVLSVGK